MVPICWYVNKTAKYKQAREAKLAMVGEDPWADEVVAPNFLLLHQNP